ncbi:coiled-coil domain-containing protein 22 [Ramlibacter sp. G-1-2-2]|uniref:Coiled-coil domain-containing protein 22 n=1 Tax=Ramlibacter agri TaxID=2728837 RepID=A0A848HAJ6_9BURK|nr:hypothetical protein [Ramlibacter agri]NML46529.1 coiled-coil domain-containing protein 22 [Ramlibacter agri]
MKFAYLLIPLAALACADAALAQGKIFRCGNTYTNDEAVAKAQGCKAMEGGNVTIVQGTKVNGNNGTRVANAPQAASGPKVDAGEQKSRDAEARTILESELKKAEARLADLQKEYNNGQPEMLGPEHRNHQKYVDRTAEIKANIDRTEQDIAGIKRELNRGNGASR